MRSSGGPSRGSLQKLSIMLKIVPTAGRIVRSWLRVPSEAAAFRWTARGLLLTFLFFSAGIGTAGYCYYRHQETAFRTGAEHQLSAVADLKVQQIVDWRANNLDDAELVAGDPFVARQAAAFLDNPRKSSLRSSLLKWLSLIREHNQGLRALLVDKQMRVQLAFPEDKTWFGPTAQAFALKALHTGQPVMSDLHRSQFSGEIHLDLAIPIGEGAKTPEPRPAQLAPTVPQPIAVVDIEVDPNRFLFPRMKSWPTPSPTAETMLVRREDDEVVILSEARHSGNAALSLRLPLSRRDLPAVEAVQGFEGVMDGVDYRNVPVLAATRHIPDTPWSIVAKVDQAEIYAPLRERGLTTAALASICVVLAAAFIAYLGRRHDNLWLQRELHERRRAEDKLRQYAAALEAANVKLEELKQAAESASREKSEFLANMSHEIRTPMTAIIGYTDLLLEHSLSPSDRYNHVAVVRRNGEHLLDLINEMLDISKIEAGKLSIDPRPCNLSALAADVASMLRPRAIERGLSLDLSYQSPIPEEITTDGPRLRQALVNLAGNAVKFTHEGGVTIVLGFLPAAADRGAAVKIGVIDTGIGITEDVLPKLFQPFAQADASTSRQYGGTGLGLSISRHLVELLGGHLSVESAPGKGSSFTIVLPAGDLSRTRMIASPSESIAQGSDVRPPTADHRPLALAGVSVLLAEDGPDNQRLVQLLLRMAGATVEIADNGRLAVDKAFSQAFDVVLMDVQMPEMDGYQATRLLRARGFREPILALTAHAMPADHQRCLEAGCDAYLTKPIDRAQLLQTIAKHVEKSRTARPDAGPLSLPERARERAVETGIDVPPPPTPHPLPLSGHHPQDGREGEESGLCSEFAGDAEMGEILDQFVAGLWTYVEKMRAALSAGHYETLKDLAHQLKGAGGSYGYRQLTDAAAVLENAARSGGLAAAADALNCLIALCGRIEAGRHAANPSEIVHS